MRGMRSFVNWHKIPEFETVSSAADDNPFAGPNSTSPSQKGIPPGTLTMLASSEISSSSLPGRLDSMGCMLRKTVRAPQYSPGHRTCLGVGREQYVNRQ